MNYLSNNNSKLRKNNIYSWGIPAGESKSGIKTCPNAGLCATGCYAMQGFYIMPSVSKAQEARLKLAESDLFIDAIDDEIKRRGVKRLRIHDSGDFYNGKYLMKWIEIINRNPQTKFYAYTKMIKLFKGWENQSRLPSNFHVIYSTGGTQDSAIDFENDRHTKVFSSLKELKQAGYSNAYKDDYAAFSGKNKIGLVYHGYKSTAWRTA